MKRRWVALILTVVMGCSLISAAVAEETALESPALAAKVEAGELPPLEERLPKNPRVAKGASAEAVYGGQLELAFSNTTSSEYGWMNKAYIVQQYGLGTTAESPEPGLVENYLVSDDARVYTFTLREGLKWSDGEPVTTEDVRFWWEDVILNEEITPTVDAMWTSNGKLMQLDILDDYTFACTFEDPYILFPWQLSLAWRSNTMFLLPSHYLKNLHKKYADEAQLAKDCADNGYDIKDWAAYFIAYGWGPDGPNAVMTAKIGCPVLTPFVLTQNPTTGVYIAERNPYYYEVDELGRQLPYVDSIRMTQVGDVSTLVMKAMSGEVDYLREQMSISDFPMLKENEEKGGYRAVPMQSHDAPFFHLNYGFAGDEEWFDVVNTREFRQAINMAIDREEIIENVYLGMAELPVHVPSEYNPDRANEMLDAIGMDKRDSEGYRLMPNGEPFLIDFLYVEYGADFPQIMEIVQDNWAQIGIRLIPKIADGALITQMNNANELHGRFFFVDFPVCNGNPVMWDWSIPIRASLRYRNFYDTTGQAGDAPIGDVLAIYEKTFEMKNAQSLEDVADKWQEIKQLVYDSCIWFLPIENKVAPVIYSDRMGNVIEDDFMIVSNMQMSYAYIKP